MAKLSYLTTLTPVETWRIARHKLPIFRGGPAWTPHELMSSSKHARGIRFAELLLRQEAIVARQMDWMPIAFEGKRVVEIGCGPLGGFGPLAIFCGAETFESAEPEWDPKLLFHPAVVEKYLRVFHADLTALYGERVGFDEFCELLDKRMRITRTGFEAAPIPGTVDIVLSQSVLEHVFPLEGTVRKLAEIQSSDTQFLHLVDFGNHYPTTNPFEGLYDAPADDYIAKRGKAINCLRMSDIARAFRAAGISANFIPSRVVSAPYPGQLHPWWQDNYDTQDLSTQLCLIAGPGKT